MEVGFYPVYWQDGLKQDICYDSDVILLMDYFGHSEQDAGQERSGHIIIRDVTHSLFSTSPSDADYYFGSLRKWCGVWTGGFAWTQDGHKIAKEEKTYPEYVALRAKAMKLKAAYIHTVEGKTAPSTCDKDYLKVFQRSEDFLEKTDTALGAERDIRCARFLDKERIQTKRRTNAEILSRAFPDQVMFREWKETDCPMFVPILVRDGRRDALRNHLIRQNIYCPVHWPITTLHRLEAKERFIYDNEISLVCDQRYTVDDMNRVVEAIQAFWKES